MLNRRMCSRLVLAALVSVLIAAPAASAMPIHPQGATTQTQDARGEAAANGGGTGAVTRLSVPAPRTWPAYPTPLPPRAAPIPDGGGGGGVDVPVVLLIIAGTLAIGGGMTVAANRLQTRPAL